MNAARRRIFIRKFQCGAVCVAAVDEEAGLTSEKWNGFPAVVRRPFLKEYLQFNLSILQHYADELGTETVKILRTKGEARIRVTLRARPRITINDPAK